jgi:UDP-glucose 4-epimerase
MARAEDLGRYYRLPADSRDLNYDKYFTVGAAEVSEFSDYTSHNTHRLDIGQVKSLLKQLDLVREAMNA